MPQFKYKARDEHGKELTGSIQAAEKKAAVSALMARSLVPLHVEPDKGKHESHKHFHGRLRRCDVEMFTRELGSLLAAGMPLSRSLKILVRETEKPALAHLVQTIYDNVSNGMSLGDAMRQWPKVFPPVYIAMIQAGETGGFLELVLAQIADFRSRERDLMSRVQSALVYPVVLCVLVVVILVFMLTYFIPRFSSIFTEFGGNLPRLTEMVVSVSNMLMKYWIITAVGAVMLVVGIKTWLSRPEGKASWDRWVLKLPIFGKLSSRFAFVRFARMLGTLISSGVPLITALQVAKESIGNSRLSETVNTSVDMVRRGMTLAGGLRICPELFSGSNIEMISIAEESSRLGEELLRLAEFNEKELDRNLKTAVSLAEPAMLFVMAALVGTIVIAMLLPIFNLQELIH
ncbi:General secretion pathway protein F [Limihaloglobus sulfuriphilus]|uniref:General secretion pathway protein F n=1 Tax=Limihaloglobus sulfuriphilus TaxID=1851148 RepID=A0A1Q2MFF2_9BACT|nr:type II secretion system F family protein [Limihaloglobus sulfuriphilus]AQQ71389.1 General secretion pathway protein F [Limihaloglobus sulfuriphilus]